VTTQPLTDALTEQIPATEDDTTKRLSRIWQDLLGVKSIGLDQNYFDLGGDSPLAVQLFAQIEKVFKVKLPIATLFEAPTIEELARILREASTPKWSPLVAVQPEGSRPPFFCVHGAGGNVLIYRDLSQQLGSDQPFYGLQSPGVDGSRPPLTRIEEMAALYVKEIRTMQPHGPYFLGGYCMGGAIAYEMAQQLRAQGAQVALLALFDTTNLYKVPFPTFWGKTYHAGEQLLFHAANFLNLDSAGKAKFFWEKVKVFQNRIPVWRGKLVGKFVKNPDTAKSKSRVLGQIWSLNDLAAVGYSPRPYKGVITEFRPLKQYRMLKNPELKWDRLAEGGQEIVVLPVYPAGMLVEPFVKHLAVALRKSVDAAIAQSGAGSQGSR
jgi:thioesterase domain-containing protein/acyl carrier protein